MRIEVDDEAELVALVGRAGLIGSDHLVDTGPIGAAEPDRRAAGEPITLERGTQAFGPADLELLQIARRQCHGAADDVRGLAERGVLAREVAHRLLHQRQEAGVDR